MTAIRQLAWAFCAVMVAACGSKPALSPQAAAVVVSEAAPPSGFVSVKELRVTSGKGCGVLGERGSVEDGYDKLRVEAAQLGAGYVQVSFVQKPPVSHQCMQHEHKLGGVAFRAPAAAKAPVAAAPVAAPAPPPPAPAPLCVPGATQACLGSGACQGAQACREDGKGYLPCDCGPAAAPTPAPAQAPAPATK
ncbi:MAG TPA: hypothetical protein VIW29_16705 [Polyangiaceae bacterium]